MTQELKQKEERYFWSGWFTGQSFALLAALYVLLSATDLIATLRLIPFGVQEGNPWARWVLDHYGTPGFIAYKALLVGIVLLITRVVSRSNARLAHIVLWGANIAMGYITILHIAILTVHMMQHTR